jgi:hypothetical protein
MICYRSSGNLINSIFLKSKKQYKFDTSIVSSLIVAINGLFGEIFENPRNMNHVAGINAHLILEVGDSIIGIVLSESISYYLAKSFKEYIAEFERYFAEEIKRKDPNLRTFKDASHLIKPIFPYFEVELNEDNSDK